MAEKIIAQYELDTTKFRQQVNGLVKSLDEVEKEGKQAATETEKSFDKAGKSAVKFSNNVKDSGSQIESLKSTLTKFAGAVGIAFSVDQIIQFGKASVAAAAEAQKNQVLLLNALNGREDIQGRLIKQATELQSKTIFEDDAIIQQQTFLATQGRTEEQIKKTIEAAVQLSAVTGDDLAVSVEKLDQTYEGSIGRLGKLDKGFKELSKAQLENGGAIDLVIQKYSGFAEAQAQTLDGQLKQLSNTFGDIQEEIGMAFIPTIQKLVTALKSASENIDFAAIFNELKKTIEILTEPTKIAIQNFNLLSDAFSGTSNTTEKAVGIIEILNTALKFLFAPTKLILQATNEIIKAFIGWYNEGGILTSVIDGLGSAVKTAYSAIKDFLGITEDPKKSVGGMTSRVSALNVVLDKNKETQRAVNDENTKSISILQAMQKEVAAITERIQTQILTGGPISQKDIDRLNLLQTKLKELPIILKGVLESTQAGFGQVSDELIRRSPLMHPFSSKPSQATMPHLMKQLSS